MKKYMVYRNIRKKAMIMGLPLMMFALQMTSVIGSLMFIIFSFSLGAIISAIIFNILLFVSLSFCHNNPTVFHLKKVFPHTINNKRASHLHYEDN
ncbi:hypothetical protein V5097_19015 [Arenibacter palladensis]|uniref:hypothetical protein n=1 Tax=Arenibacter palladensis TaxID=237373 RepID=UPI002FD0ACAB